MGEIIIKMYAEPSEVSIKKLSNNLGNIAQGESFVGRLGYEITKYAQVRISSGFNSNIVAEVRPHDDTSGEFETISGSVYHYIYVVKGSGKITTHTMEDKMGVIDAVNKYKLLKEINEKL